MQSAYRNPHRERAVTEGHYEKTNETTPDGRPIWECPKCGARVAGHVVANHSCPGTPPKLTTTVLPCKHRGSVMGRLRKPGCDCWSVVFGCSFVEGGLCSLGQTEGVLMGRIPVDCAKCDDRKPL